MQLVLLQYYAYSNFGPETTAQKDYCIDEMSLAVHTLCRLLLNDLNFTMFHRYVHGIKYAYIHVFRRTNKICIYYVQVITDMNMHI